MQQWIVKKNEENLSNLVTVVCSYHFLMGKKLLNPNRKAFRTPPLFSTRYQDRFANQI